MDVPFESLREWTIQNEHLSLSSRDDTPIIDGIGDAVADQNPNGGAQPEHDQQSHAQMDASGPNRKSRKTLGLIIAGGVLLVAVIVVILIVVNSPQPEDCSAPGSCGQPLPPTATPTAKAEEPQDTVVALDSATTFENPPRWKFAEHHGWDAVPMEEETALGFSNVSLGCNFFAGHDTLEVDRTSNSDLPHTATVFEELQNAMEALDPNFDVVTAGTLNLALTAPDSREFIEFATITIDYSMPEGDFTSEFFGRAMPHSGIFMLSQLDCPSTVMNSSDSPRQEIIDAIVVVPQS